jgi:hypothetical protein
MGRALKLPAGVQELEKVDGRAGADTIRLWESYRDQAYLWRALAILQVPATGLATIAALLMFFFADTVIDVPEKPQPGYYSARQLPDSEFVDFATRIINLITTFQPKVARAQFTEARKCLWEPALTEFENKMMIDELKAIEQSSRSQVFFIDPAMTRVDRYPEEDRVVVRLFGVRQKLIGRTTIPQEEMVYYVTMTTIPRNVQNEYGIVVVNIQLRKIDAQTLADEDRKEEQARRHAARFGQ